MPLVFFSFNQDNVKLDKEPTFKKLTYADSGLYECEVTMGPLSRKASFELVVEGMDSNEDFFSQSSLMRPLNEMQVNCDKSVLMYLRPVKGAPVIRQLSKRLSEDKRHKVLICEAEGSPKPTVSWSINGTSVCTHVAKYIFAVFTVFPGSLKSE